MADLSRRLFVTDLDGTLLDDRSLVSDTSAALLRRLAAKGVMVTAATARTPATLDPLLRQTGICVPAVVMTGAALWDCAGRRYIDMRLVGVDDAVAVGRTVTDCGLTPMVYKRGDGDILQLYYPRGMGAVEQRFVDERSRLELKKTHVDDDPCRRLAEPDTVLVLAMGPEENVKEAVDRLRRSGRPLSVSYYTDPFYPGVCFLEVFGPGVSKAEGLRRLKELVGATHVTVFGDSYNDLSMMREADLAVAVENAAPMVREAADLVIGSNTSDAVARYIADAAGV